MKKMLVLFTLGLTLFPTLGFCAQTAHARLFCLSLRFQRGIATDSIGFRWTMDVTTLDFGINGELAPEFFVGGYSNGAWIELEEELFGDNFSGALALDTPDFVDANGNGHDDFFEVSQPVPSRTAVGAFNLPGFGSGPITAIWYREAGSAFGACAYTIPNPFGGALNFQHGFELIEYHGTLSYTPASNTLSASLSLTNTNTLATLEGPAMFVKSPTNRFNLLTLETAFLTNNALQVLDFYIDTPFLRRTNHATNYVGYVEFNDGDPNTIEEDYYTWRLSIDDANDTDKDGIPDFSDDPPGASPPRPPHLSLARGATNLLFTLSGDVGRLHHLLETGDLVSGNWVTNLSLTLTNDPQTISIPLPATSPRYWRARAQ